MNHWMFRYLQKQLWNMIANYYSLKNSAIARFNTAILKSFFKNIGKNVLIASPLKINGFRNISLGNDVVISYKTWLAALPISSDECLLKIGNGTVIGHFNHIYATKLIRIGEKVLTADKVYISDNLHRYHDPNIPIIEQGITQLEPVEIGDGSWIGENAVILGAKVGKHCVIGANSVVTKDIPEYSVVVGNPARIIKRYIIEKNVWETVGN